MAKRDPNDGLRETRFPQDEADQASTLELAEKIDILCDEFEDQWKRGNHPEVSDYVTRIKPEARQELLRHLLLLDVEYRNQAGCSLDAKQYANRLPQYRDVIAVLLADETLDWSPHSRSKSTIARARGNKPKSSSGQFGDYRLFEELGRGGMGVVYRARQSSLNRDVAVKIILPGRYAGPAARQRFLLEAEAAANLAHAGVVSVYEIGEHEGHPFFSMELVDGCSLNDLVKQGPIEPDEAARLVRDAADIIEFAHQQGIVHRDLKPANILQDSHGNVRITDFGLAKRDEEDSGLTITGDVLGTPCYMPPEQAEGRVHDIGPVSDVYSLGAVLYCLLVGRPPFLAATLPETLRQVSEKTPVAPRKLNPQIPADLDTICSKCLDKHPNSRYQSARDLADELQRFQDRVPIKARAVGYLHRGWRWCRREPLLATMFATLAFLAIAGPLIAIHQHALRKQLVRAQQQEVTARTTALLSAAPEAVPAILISLKPQLQNLRERLLALHVAEDASPQQRLRTALALASTDSDARAYLRQVLLRIEPREFLLVRQALTPPSPTFSDALWKTLIERPKDTRIGLRAACYLAHTDPEDDRWRDLAPEVVEWFLAQDQLEAATWVEAMRPLRHHLLAPLSNFAAHDLHPMDQRLLATRAVAAYAKDKPVALVHVMVRADARQGKILQPVADQIREKVVPLFREVASAEQTSDGKQSTETERDQRARCRAVAAIALAHSGDPNLLRTSLHSDNNRLRSYVIHLCQPFGIPAKRLLERLNQSPKAPELRSLLLCLGTYSHAEVERQTSGLFDESSLVDQVARLHREHPDAGVHSAAQWLLKQWGQHSVMRRPPVAESMDSDERQWYVHPEGLTMVKVIEPDAFWMGSPPTQPYRDSDEVRHSHQIPHSFAIAATEVTNAQFDRFLAGNRHIRVLDSAKYSPHPAGPRVVVNWFQATGFCNWLSERAGIPEEQWCYPRHDQLVAGAPLAEDWQKRFGYRLPTEAEWEYACRASSITPRFYGFDDSLLAEYAWCQGRRETVQPTGSLMPNDFGLFDVYGNAWEWCGDQRVSYESQAGPSGVPAPLDPSEGQPEADQPFPLVNLRGGSIVSGPRYLRSADRSWYPPYYETDMVGFRPARTLPSDR